MPILTGKIITSIKSLFSRKGNIINDIGNAKKWLATEHYYFLELAKDLEKLKTTIQNVYKERSLNNIKAVLDKAYEKQEEKKIDNVYHDFRYLSRSTLKLNRKVAEVIKDFNLELEKNPELEKTQIRKLNKELRIAANSIIEESSRYEGNIRKCLDNLKKAIFSEVFDMSKITQSLNSLEQAISETDRWINAESGALEQAEGFTRRTLFKKTGTVATAVAGVGVFGIPSLAYAGNISMREIEREMRKDKVEDILGNSVRYIKPSEWQSAVDNSSKDGVLVFAYTNQVGRETNKRSAIMFKELAKKYSGQIVFLACDSNDTIKKFGVGYAPSIAMYKKGKKIDVLEGGPSENKWIPNVMGNNEFWIENNIFGMHLEHGIWRYNNTYKFKQVK